jgi:hypothetical protein
LLYIQASGQNSVSALWVRNPGKIRAGKIVSGHEMDYQGTYGRVQDSSCVRSPQPAHLSNGEGRAECHGVYPAKFQPLGLANRGIEGSLQIGQE